MNDSDMLNAVLVMGLQESRGIYLRRRGNLSDAELKAVQHAPPDWVLGSNSLLMSQYRDQQVLLSEGRLVWSYVIQANELLHKPGGPNCPAAVVFADSADMDMQLDRLSQIASRLFETKGNENRDPELKRFAELITGEKEVCLNLPIPHSRTGGLDVFYTTIMVHREQLPAPVLSAPFLPLLVCPEKTAGTMILPGIFWAEPLKKVFTLTLKKSAVPAAAPAPSTPSRVSYTDSKPKVFHPTDDSSSGCFGKVADILIFLAIMGVVRMVVRSSIAETSHPPPTNYNRSFDPAAPIAPYNPLEEQSRSTYTSDDPNEVATLDQKLKLCASLMSGRANGVLINRTGYEIAPALTKLMDHNPQAAVPRLVLYSLLKFARPIKAHMKSNVNYSGMEDYYKPLETLGSETLDKESPLGRAFTAMLLQAGKPADQGLTAAGVYTAPEVYAWWRTHSDGYSRFAQLDEWLNDPWTVQYVLPKLSARSNE